MTNFDSITQNLEDMNMQSEIMFEIIQFRLINNDVKIR